MIVLANWGTLSELELRVLYVNSDKLKMCGTIGMTKMSYHWIKKGGAPGRVLRVSYLDITFMKH